MRGQRVGATPSGALARRGGAAPEDLYGSGILCSWFTRNVVDGYTWAIHSLFCPEHLAR